VAEQLGDAVLTVRADTQALDAGLARARQNAEQTGAAIGQSFTKSGQALQTAANGLQYYIDAQGRARDASGRFVTNVELQAAGLQKLGSASAGAASGILSVGAASSRAVVGVEALKASLATIAAQLAIFETVRRIAFFTGDQITQVDKASAAVRTLGVDSKELGLRLEALSLQLGNSVSKAELIKAAYDVASSGFADAASATQILKASALGAQGGFTQLDDVVRAVTGVINAYGLTADKATTIVDQFLQTQNDGVITVRQYAAEIGNVASIAAAGGVSLEQLNAAIATATLRGVPVSQTFTGIRQAISSILKPSQQAAELAASLGVQFNVSALQTKGLAGVLADVQQRTGGAADKIAILLGSVEAQAAIQPLLNDNLAKYNELLGKQANANGAAAKAAEINADTISGQLTKIGNGFSNLATNLDSVLSPVFKRLLDVVDKLLQGINKALLFNPSRVSEAAKEAGSLTTDLSAGLGPQRFTYQGKTYTGSALEIRRALTRDIVLGEVGGAQTATAPPSRGTPSAAGSGGAVVSPDQLALIQRQSDLEITGLREKLDLARQLAGLNSVDRARLEGEVTLNEKLRSIENTRAQLRRELAKPLGAGTGSPSEQDPAKVLSLQNQIRAGQIEAETIAVRNRQAEVEASRAQGDRLRQIQLENEAADQKLSLTVKQTALEREALRTGVEVSRTAQLRLQLQDQIATATRQERAAREALATELSRPKEDQSRLAVADLVVKLNNANNNVRQAYADAGKSLVENARSAAGSLKSAQESIQGSLRGGFQFLSGRLQREQLERARAAIQPLVDRGVIRTGLDISSPEKLFGLASFAESFTKAQANLDQALAENAKATAELVAKNWNVVVQLPQQQTVLALSNT
jgi:TP901 family phage tail tape measure protein